MAINLGSGEADLSYTSFVVAVKMKYPNYSSAQNILEDVHILRIF